MTPTTTPDDEYKFIDEALDWFNTGTVSCALRGIIGTEEVLSEMRIAKADARKQIISHIQRIADEQHKIGIKNGRFGYVPIREVKRLIEHEKIIHRQSHGRSDCKNCTLIENLEQLFNKENK